MRLKDGSPLKVMGILWSLNFIIWVFQLVVTAPSFFNHWTAKIRSKWRNSNSRKSSTIVILCYSILTPWQTPMPWTKHGAQRYSELISRGYGYVEGGGGGCGEEVVVCSQVDHYNDLLTIYGGQELHCAWVGETYHWIKGDSGCDDVLGRRLMRLFPLFLFCCCEHDIQLWLLAVVAQAPFLIAAIAQPVLLSVLILFVGESPNSSIRSGVRWVVGHGRNVVWVFWRRLGRVIILGVCFGCGGLGWALVGWVFKVVYSQILFNL